MSASKTAGTNNPGVTRKLDNPFKGVQNNVPLKHYDTIKGISNLVPKRSRSQWLRGLTVHTQIDIKSSKRPIISPCLMAPARSS